MTSLRFTFADLERAHAEWGCNCGPASLAAICNLTPDEVRPHFPTFKGWTNPAMMITAVDRVCQNRRRRTPTRDGHGIDWPRYGLALIQWEGPWTEPCAPARERWAKIDRAKRTHWVGVKELSEQVSISGERDIGIWDINAFQDPCNGWLEKDIWDGSIVPALTADIKRASGGWYVAHAIDVAWP